MALDNEVNLSGMAAQFREVVVNLRATWRPDDYERLRSLCWDEVADRLGAGRQSIVGAVARQVVHDAWSAICEIGLTPDEVVTEEIPISLRRWCDPSTWNLAVERAASEPATMNVEEEDKLLQSRVISGVDTVAKAINVQATRKINSGCS